MTADRHKRAYRRGGFGCTARFPVMRITDAEITAIEEACEIAGLSRTEFGRLALLAMAQTVREHDALAGIRALVGSVVDEYRLTGPDDARPALVALTMAVAPGVAMVAQLESSAGQTNALEEHVDGQACHAVS